MAKQGLKKGQTLAPVRISGREITTTFWGTAWCENLQQYSDYGNRLPRGRTYARNGSIVNLQISAGKIKAIVAGSSPYQIEIKIQKLADATWKKLCLDCAQSIHSLIDLMRGKLPDTVLQRLTEPKSGMFPAPREIRLSCNCPDSASLCKHLAAVMYGIGYRLDTQPELFFQLRGVDQHDLISEAMDSPKIDAALKGNQASEIDADDLSSIFGIDLVSEAEKPNASKPVGRKAAKKKSTGTKKKVAKKKPAKKNALKKKR